MWGRNSRLGQWGAFALLALAIAAAALSFSVLYAWDSPVVPGAPKFRSSRPDFRVLAS